MPSMSSPALPRVEPPTGRIADAWIAPLAAVGRVAVFAGRLAKVASGPPAYPAEWLEHAASTCFRALLPVCTIVASFGAVVALQGLNIFRVFGTGSMLPSLVGI